MDEADRPAVPDRQPDGSHPAVARVDPSAAVRRPIAPLFAFVQFELPWALAPLDGRYAVREEPSSDAEGVIVFQRGEAPARRRFSRRSLRPAEDAPEAVPITRVTVVDATRHEEPAARHWLHQADGRERGEELIAAALLSVNRALRAYATAQAEPWRGPVVDADALVIRLGFGTGEEVADGEWTDAAEHRARSDRKRGADVNAERWVMATMNARVAQPVAASIALEARAEAESGHPREAALLGQLAIRALLADPPPGLEPDDDADLERIRGMGAALEATADACLTRDPSAEESADSLVAIKLVQRVLRRARERATGSG